MSESFSNLIDILREEGKFYNEPSFYFAKVTSELPNLKVMINNMELDKNNLLIDKSLLDRHNYYINCSESSIKHNLQDKLSIGDKVVMLRDSNKFIIISKVVNI